MNITLNIQVDSPAELQEAISGLANVLGGTVVQVDKATTDVTEKPKRTSSVKKKDQTKAETTEKAEVTDQVESDSGNIPTVVDLRAKAQEKGKTPEGKKAIKALLQEFDSKSISDVPEDRRAAFLAELEAL